ncbi:MAG: hypothetical protein ACYTEQ_01005 [Planctomycetota bacterium]|jgi:hypothetical protein
MPMIEIQTVLDRLTQIRTDEHWMRTELDEFIEELAVANDPETQRTFRSLTTERRD